MEDLQSRPQVSRRALHHLLEGKDGGEAALGLPKKLRSKHLGRLTAGSAGTRRRLRPYGLIRRACLPAAIGNLCHATMHGVSGVLSIR
jgi:hypothetical protein